MDSIQKIIEEINNIKINTCGICKEEIMNLDHAVLLTHTDMFMFNLNHRHMNNGLLLMCDNCFKELIAEFESDHRVEQFCGKTLFDNEIWNRGI